MSDEWAGITSYVLDSDGLHEVEAFRRNPETGEVTRVLLRDGQKVGFMDDRDIPDEFDLLGMAEDYREPPNIWEVWATDDGEWGTVKVSDMEPSILQPAPEDTDDSNDD